MAETLETIPWGIGNRIAVAWGNPRKPQGTTGLRDAITGDYINEDGVVTLASVVNEDGEQLTGLSEDVACSYLPESRGVHFYVLSTPETYGLEVGNVLIARLQASAGVLLGLGDGERVLRLEVVDRY